MRRRALLGGNDDDLFVDLGLPSGIKWAKGNICRNGNSYYIGEPTDYGCYFSWGNVEGHNSNDLRPYPSGTYYFSNDYYDTSLGRWAAGNIQSSQYDAAHCNLGGDKRMPNRDDFIELFNNMASAYMTFNGVDGWMVWNRDCASYYYITHDQYEDCRLFFPDAGYIDYSYVASNADRGYYWTAQMSSNGYPYYLYFNENRYNADSANDAPRCRGCSIRAIMD